MDMDNDKPHDPLPAALAGVDQAVEAMPVMAEYAWGVFQAFRDVGFSDDQAMVLTRDQITRAMED